MKGAERRVFIASGLICCQECGRPMIGQSAHGPNNIHRYYVHSFSKGDVITCSVKRIRADEVEETISRHISTVLKEGGYLDQVAKRIAGQGKEHQVSIRTSRARLSKELRECEQEMEMAFKLQLKAEAGANSERFVLEKLETLGKRKLTIENALSESSTNVISLAEVREDLENRVHSVTRGWSKLPATHKRRALRRLIQRLAIGPKGMSINYYSCALGQDGTSGAGAGEIQRTVKVLTLPPRGIRSRESKESVGNCLSAKMVNQSL